MSMVTDLALILTGDPVLISVEMFIGFIQRL
jgi:hypothetical protein